MHFWRGEWGWRKKMRAACGSICVVQVHASSVVLLSHQRFSLCPSPVYFSQGFLDAVTALSDWADKWELKFFLGICTLPLLNPFSDYASHPHFSPWTKDQGCDLVSLLNTGASCFPCASPGLPLRWKPSRAQGNEEPSAFVAWQLILGGDFHVFSAAGIEILLDAAITKSLGIPKWWGHQGPGPANALCKDLLLMRPSMQFQKFWANCTRGEAPVWQWSIWLQALQSRQQLMKTKAQACDCRSLIQLKYHDAWPH